jgi:hypothetical protein
MWPNTFEDLLLEWNNLRAECLNHSLEDALHLVHDWWARAPLTNHYLHPADYEDWPLPWDLLADNTFCDIAKCLGIVYTLYLLEHPEIKSADIIQTDNYYVVSVNNERYILNDQPGQIEYDDVPNVKSRIEGDFFKNRLK